MIIRSTLEVWLPTKGTRRRQRKKTKHKIFQRAFLYFIISYTLCFSNVSSFDLIVVNNGVNQTQKNCKKTRMCKYSIITYRWVVIVVVSTSPPN